MSFCLQKRLASSAKRWKSKSVEPKMKVINIYLKKRTGPRTDPCGIPQDILVRSDSMPLTVTNC